MTDLKPLDIAKARARYVMATDDKKEWEAAAAFLREHGFLDRFGNFTARRVPVARRKKKKSSRGSSKSSRGSSSRGFSKSFFGSSKPSPCSSIRHFSKSSRDFSKPKNVETDSSWLYGRDFAVVVLVWLVGVMVKKNVLQV